MAGEYIPMETMKIKKDDQDIATITRVLDSSNFDNRLKIDFNKNATDIDRMTIKDIFSRNISIFGKGKTGSIKWIYFKKGTIEHWAFAGVELEKRKYQVMRDKKTTDYLKQLIKNYFPK
jgi:hypothetical protein